MKKSLMKIQENDMYEDFDITDLNELLEILIEERRELSGGKMNPILRERRLIEITDEIQQIRAARANLSCMQTAS